MSFYKLAKKFREIACDLQTQNNHVLSLKTNKVKILGII